jgi:outer membrane receptor protein involved in Fe transport
VNFTSILFNAPARDYGAELSASMLLTPTLTADVGVAYLHTKVMDVELPDGTFGDQVQPLSPNLAATANLRKEWHESFGTIFAQGTVAYVGSRFYGSVNQPELLGPSYVQGNLSGGYTSPNGKWNSILSVRNVGDKAIIVDRFDVVSSGGYSERSYAPPRWVTFEVRYNF